jgi:hypothetical protein
MAEQVSGSSRRELPPSGSRHARRSEVDGGPQKLVVPGRCGIHQRAFLLLVQSEATETWKVMSAVPAPQETGDVTQASSPSIELVGRLEVRGSVVLAHDYIGCPFCGGEGIFECGCGVLNCGGGNRSHGDHKDYLCAGCGRWRCMGKAGKVDSLSGFAETRTRVSVAYPNELPRNEASPSLKRVDRPQLPPGRALVRRH